VIALIGDSHAHALFPGVAEAAKAEGKSAVLLANSSCPPLLGAVTGDTLESRAECAQRIRQILDTVSAMESVETVIMTTRGAVYMTGDGFGPAEAWVRGKPIHSAEGKDSNPSKIYLDGLQATTEFLTVRGKRLIYLLEVPENGINPANCIGRPLYLGRRTSCEVSREMAEKRQAAYREGVRTISGLTILDPFPVFCSEQVCEVLREGNTLYTDHTHLSVFGAELVGRELIAPALRQ
jgi:hypothetical protein